MRVIREINTRAEQVAAYEAIRDCPVQQILRPDARSEEQTVRLRRTT